MRNGWIQENVSWSYYINDKVQSGWLQDNDGRWYYLNSRGIMKTGWILDNDRYYYLQKEKSEENHKTYYSGEMRTGWVKICGQFYYFVDKTDKEKFEYKGQCVINTLRIIDGKTYRFDVSGAWVEYTQDYMYVSDEFCRFIEQFEGCILTAYCCPSGIKTIGIGTTRSECTSLGKITRDKAYEFFREDIKNVCNSLTALCRRNNVKLRQNEYEALVSFVHNCGIGSLSKSTLWRHIKEGIRERDIISEDFCMWVRSSKGEVLEGLVRRRKAESALFAGE